ncbi:amylo-alpha-1,6-glucosidase [Nanoarchaeota archaeon]
MHITYQFPKLKHELNCDSSSFTLANGLGSFLFLSNPPISKYNGIYLNNNLEPFKILENIRMKDADYQQMEIYPTSITRKSRLTDSFHMPKDIQGIIYKTSKTTEIQLDFDCKRPYDPRTLGRYYYISTDDNTITVRFTKMTDKDEDSTHKVKEYDLFCVIQPISCNLKKDYQFIDQWTSHDYSFDRSRNDHPANRYIYTPFVFHAKGALIAFARTKQEALKQLALLNRYKKPKNHAPTLPDKFKTIPEDIATTFLCAQSSLDRLTVNHEHHSRLFAGYPWFFQFWTRDESISTIGLIKTDQLEQAKDILMLYIDRLDIDGRIQNRLPASSLGSADGVGWVWKRLRDLMVIAEEKEILHKLFTKEDFHHITEQLKKSISLMLKHHLKDNLIYNAPCETWMDTRWNKQDGREGFCIEIQCQFLEMLEFAYELTNDESYLNRLAKIKTIVKKEFFNNTLLADRKDDFTIRPNIFIAHYTYPALLTKQEWTTVFENSLKRLWLDWGSLSSIDTHHHLFTPNHTGIPDQSYHRGDAWYWINNLAAICLHRNNPTKFKPQIDAIINSSIKETLTSGSLGDSAEVSDASHLSSKGCLAQTWSTALFIELIHEVYSE